MCLLRKWRSSQMRNRIEVIEFPYEKGLLYGLPVRVYEERCEPDGWLAGWLLDFLVTVFGFNGALMLYDCGYWEALWFWLFKWKPEEE